METTFFFKSISLKEHFKLELQVDVVHFQVLPFWAVHILLDSGYLYHCGTELYRSISYIIDCFASFSASRQPCDVTHVTWSTTKAPTGFYHVGAHELDMIQVDLTYIHSYKPGRNSRTRCRDFVPTNEPCSPARCLMRCLTLKLFSTMFILELVECCI